jgi:uncharacterized membrane protein YhiD involved in acid resistance
MDLQEIAARLGSALLLGALIGFERRWRPRMAVSACGSATPSARARRSADLS